MSLREELLAQEYEERTKPRGFVYFKDADGQVVAKTCRKCGELKHAKNYHHKSDGFGQLDHTVKFAFLFLTEIITLKIESE
ncbi:hypothetical protein GYH73_029540 [Bacillus megaterium]|nr:hypothetical protein [Priestia megaterium]